MNYFFRLNQAEFGIWNSEIGLVTIPIGDNHREVRVTFKPSRG
jgi:hypothetical protein